MTKHHKNKPWCRYADDGIAHCKTESEAQALLIELKKRFSECRLELHPEKTKIIYCKDNKRTGEYQNTKFTFLGYDFQGRQVMGKYGRFFSFTPSVSKEGRKEMNTVIRNLSLRRRTDLEIESIAEWINPIMRGWINYYGKYNKSGMYCVFNCFNRTLVRWARKKYKNLRASKTQAVKFMECIADRSPNLFAHWRYVDGFI
ncbi:MAG TPA: RNA-directed DNA polymerase [Lentisphaeria bacterium]|nr:MAG: hypothetical protein A2X47_08075 [Lentisphaerae bacterium GWF2_38_69]HBM16416.1 RNA-directed DNA polymerase [Lentisphaeria bacterium]